MPHPASMSRYIGGVMNSKSPNWGEMPHPASMSRYIGGVMSQETARAARMKKKSGKRRENEEKKN